MSAYHWLLFIRDKPNISQPTIEEVEHYARTMTKGALFLLDEKDLKFFQVVFSEEKVLASCHIGLPLDLRYTLIDPSIPETERLSNNIFGMDLGGSFPAQHLVPREWAIEAVNYFFNFRLPTPNLTWKEKYDPVTRD